MYFSGHLLDDYSEDIAKERCDSVSELLDAFSDVSEITVSYREKDKVTICGMITAKTVKNTRNGAQMAFLTVEDRYAEIEVIVFPKQLEGYASVLLPDTAVRIRGTLTEREEDGVKVILSSAEPLTPNGKKTGTAGANTQSDACLYLRVPSLAAKETGEALEMVRFSPGTVPVVFYDASTGKTHRPKNTGTSPSELLLGALRALLGESNVVLRS